MKTAIALAISLSLTGCASVFDGPAVPFGKTEIGGKTITVKRLGTECQCARPTQDGPFGKVVGPARAGCNDGNANICTSDSIYVFNHEAWELTTRGSHSDFPDPVTGCYRITKAGGEFKVGDHLCVGQFGDYRIPG